MQVLKSKALFRSLSAMLCCLLVIASCPGVGFCASAEDAQISADAVFDAALAPGTQAVGQTVKVQAPFYFAFLHAESTFFSSVSAIVFSGSYVTVLSYGENYTKVRLNSGRTGYLFSAFLQGDGDGILSLNRSYDHIYQGAAKEGRLHVTYTGNRNLTWSVSPKGIVSVDGGTGTIKGIKPGTAVLTVSAGTQSASCTIHCIYKWKQAWATKALTATTMYTGPGTGYGSIVNVPKGTALKVYGDEGGANGWAYCSGTVGGTERWGFVKIGDISTKNTVSFYNSLGWRWPLKDESINFISSPYAPRSDSTSTTIHHRGMDITTGKPGEIRNKEVVAAFTGTVKNVRNNIDSCGYCVSLRSDSIDPVTNKRICGIYMHLISKPTYSNGNAVVRGDIIPTGTTIGRVGNTNGGTDPDMGYHLHFEANNFDAGVGEEGRSDFVHTLNPIFFYANKTIVLSKTSEAYQTGKGAYWYATQLS